MTITLLILSLVAAVNPSRVAAAAPKSADRGIIGSYLATFLLASCATALVGGPLLDLVEVTGPSARIAAGIALLVVALKDAIMRAPTFEPALRGWKAGAIPLAFPVAFSPAAALLIIAGADDRGIGVALIGAAIASTISIATVLGPVQLRSRLAVSAVGVAGAGVAAFVVLDGVYAI